MGTASPQSPKKHCKSTDYTYLMNGTPHDYLCGINDQAEEMFNRIVSHMADIQTKS